MLQVRIRHVLTFNLTGTPVISAANGKGVYKLLTGLDLTDSIEGSNTSFVFNAPSGYKVALWDPVGGSTPGKNHYIYVQLALAPEPSTYALLGLGLLWLVALRRFRRVDA